MMTQVSRKYCGGIFSDGERYRKVSEIIPCVLKMIDNRPDL